MLTNTFIQSSTHIFTKAEIYSQWTALTYKQAQIHTDTVTFMLMCKSAQTKNPNNKYTKKMLKTFTYQKRSLISSHQCDENLTHMPAHIQIVDLKPHEFRHQNYQKNKCDSYYCHKNPDVTNHEWNLWFSNIILGLSASQYQ